MNKDDLIEAATFYNTVFPQMPIDIRRLDGNQAAPKIAILDKAIYDFVPLESVDFLYHDVLEGAET